MGKLAPIYFKSTAGTLILGTTAPQIENCKVSSCKLLLSRLNFSLIGFSASGNFNTIKNLSERDLLRGDDKYSWSFGLMAISIFIRRIY